MLAEVSPYHHRLHIKSKIHHHLAVASAANITATHITAAHVTTFSFSRSYCINTNATTTAADTGVSSSITHQHLSLCLQRIR